MAAIITEKFRTHNAKQFKEDFSAAEGASSTYIFIGRSFPWPNDAVPTAPANSVGEELDAWSDMIALKKVPTGDVTHGLVRYNWTENVVYDEYQHDVSASNTSTATSASNIYDSRFYVMTEEYNVYKCIRTGRDGNGAVVASTVKPVGTSSTTLIQTADANVGTGRGYIWKYMYSISASDVIKFVTNDFIPVKTIGAQTEIFGNGTNGGLGTQATNDSTAQWDVEADAVDGSILHIEVTEGGSGHTNGTGTYAGVNIDGDGINGKCSVHVSGGKITHVTVTTPGSGYRRASIDTAGISGLGGSGSVIKPILSPIVGHGADPVEELGGNYIIINSRFEFGEGGGDFPTDNDFRRIGLCQDPFAKGTTTVGSATSMTAYSQMTLSGAAGLAPDDIIMDTSSDGVGVAVSRIVSVNGTVISHIPVANSEGGYANFAAADVVFKAGANIGTVSAVNASHPEVEHYSGNIMYIENRGAVSRAADQIEDIKLIIEM
jgi:hypothetical protein